MPLYLTKSILHEGGCIKKGEDLKSKYGFQVETPRRRDYAQNGSGGTVPVSA